MKIKLDGKPIAKQRARHTTKGKFVVTYDPQSSDKIAVRNKLIKIVNEAINSEDKQTSIEASNLSRINSYSVDLTFYFPVNESDSTARKNAKLWGMELPTCKPDYDNLEKFYLDCANGVLWQDDRMIVDGRARKRYGNPARVEIEVMESPPVKLSSESESLYKMINPLELDQFLDDAFKLGKQNMYDHISFEGKVKNDWMEETASYLKRFIRRHRHQIMKISKLLEDE